MPTVSCRSEKARESASEIGKLIEAVAIRYTVNKTKYCRRFAQLQSRLGLALLLKNFKLTLNKRTKIPLEYDNSFPGWMIKDGIWLDIAPL